MISRCTRQSSRHHFYDRVRQGPRSMYIYGTNFPHLSKRTCSRWQRCKVLTHTRALTPLVPSPVSPQCSTHSSQSSCSGALVRAKTVHNNRISHLCKSCDIAGCKVAAERVHTICKENPTVKTADGQDQVRGVQPMSSPHLCMSTARSLVLSVVPLKGKLLCVSLNEVQQASAECIGLMMEHTKASRLTSSYPTNRQTDRQSQQTCMDACQHTQVCVSSS